MKSYEFDIAISLCKQDVKFARKLVSQLNPSLKIFFYEDQQEVLINKSGPEFFGKIFKEKSRVVVILSRDEWSESYYTDIERNAIIDRTSVRNEGFNFLFVIPMVHGQVPSWYPTTRIYADPARFSIELLARFIEFKVTDQDGFVKQLTLEDRYEQFMNKLTNKMNLVRLQETTEAINLGKKEVIRFKELFNQKLKTLVSKSWDRISGKEFTPFWYEAFLKISDFQLECRISTPDWDTIRVVTTQDLMVNLELVQISNSGDRKLLSETTLLFFYSEQLLGWSEPLFLEEPTQREIEILYRTRDNSRRYDLRPPVTTEVLVDFWFQELFRLATGRTVQYL